MPWKLAETARFSRDLRDLSKEVRAAISKAVDGMVTDPGKAQIVKLGGDRWRLRVGSWRVFLKLDTATGTIFLLSISRRTSTTY